MYPSTPPAAHTETPSSPWVVMVPGDGDAVNPCTGTKYTEYSPLKIGCPAQTSAAAAAPTGAAPAAAAAPTGAAPLPPSGAAIAAADAAAAAAALASAAPIAAPALSDATQLAVGELAPLIAGLQQLVEAHKWHSISLRVDVTDPTSGSAPFEVTLKPPAKRALHRGLSVEASGPARAGAFHANEAPTAHAELPGIGLSISPSGPPRAGAFHAALEVKPLRPGGAVGIGLCVSPSGPPRAGAFHAGPEIKAGMSNLAAAADAADGAPPPPPAQ